MSAPIDSKIPRFIPTPVGKKNGPHGKTALMEAAARGDIDEICTLLQHGEDIEAADDFGKTALMYAAIECQQEAIKTLIDKGANINAIGDKGNTALMCAITSVKDKHLAVVTQLVFLGADTKKAKANYWIGQRNSQKRIKAAINEGKARLMKTDRTTLSGEQKQRVEEYEIENQSCSNKWPCPSYDSKIPRFIPTPVGKKNGPHGKTALMEAAARGDIDEICTLLQKGADIEAADDFGKTALMYAAIECQQEAIKTLIDKGANINAIGDKGNTALMCAITSVKDKHLAVVTQLVFLGADTKKAKANYWIGQRNSQKRIKAAINEGKARLMKTDRTTLSGEQKQRVEEYEIENQSCSNKWPCPSYPHLSKKMLQ